MAEDTTTQTEQTTAPEAAVQPQAHADAATASPTKAAPAKRASSKAKASSDDAAPTKHKCAGCGKTVLFVMSQSVGGREPIEYHGCPESEQIMHDYFVASMEDPNAAPPIVAVD